MWREETPQKNTPQKSQSTAKLEPNWNRKPKKIKIKRKN